MPNLILLYGLRKHKCKYTIKSEFLWLKLAVLLPQTLWELQKYGWGTNSAGCYQNRFPIHKCLWLRHSLSTFFSMFHKQAIKNCFIVTAAGENIFLNMYHSPSLESVCSRSDLENVFRFNLPFWFQMWFTVPWLVTVGVEYSLHCISILRVTHWPQFPFDNWKKKLNLSYI